MDELTGEGPIGPVEFTLLEFPRASFDGEISAVLADLVDREIVSIFDLLLVTKADDGAVTVVELIDVEPAIGERFATVDGDVMWLLSEQDVAEAAGALQPNTTGILVVWENTWARQLRSAVTAAGGRLVVHDRLDADAVAEAIASASGGK
jgi:hypothetical protein